MTAPRDVSTVAEDQPEEALMAICNIIESPGRTAEQFELIGAHVRSTGPVPTDGCRLVLIGEDRAITVWDSPNDRDRFLAERLAPAYQAAGLSLDDAERTQFEVDMLVARDLTGAVR
jgi:hypothetical protein